MPAVVNIKNKYLTTRFSEKISAADMATAQNTGFFEELFMMITPRTMKELPANFFDLRRAARIIGRQEGFPKDEQESKGFDLLMEKPLRLMKVYDIPPSKEWKKERKRGGETEETGITPDDTDLKLALKAFYAEFHRPPKVTDGNKHLPEDSKSWGAIKRERQAAKLSTFGQMYTEVLKQEVDAARMAAIKAAPVEPTPAQKPPAPVADETESQQVRRELTPAETHEAIGKHFAIKGRLPGTGSGYVGLPECSYAWSTVVTKLQLKHGSVEVFVADYEFKNPEVTPLPIPIKGPVVYATEVFNALVDGLNKEGKIPHIIGKHRAVDIDESFLLDRVMFVESLIHEDAPKPLRLVDFAKAAGLVKEEDGKIVPAPDHRLITWKPAL